MIFLCISNRQKTWHFYKVLGNTVGRFSSRSLSYACMFCWVCQELMVLTTLAWLWLFWHQRVFWHREFLRDEIMSSSGTKSKLAYCLNKIMGFSCSVILNHEANPLHGQSLSGLLCGARIKENQCTCFLLRVIRVFFFARVSCLLPAFMKW